ncbi:MAG: GNAT family N-acetyltransferase [Candidatus Cloacimonetes bacterium]|nr:GNAT family N-acetyltransferase [Candidatus Cloacimonadota bacterium]
MTIRKAMPEELSWIRSLASQEGWNPGVDDMPAFYAQDPQGFLVGELEGKPIGTISCVRYENNFGFIGFYIVLPEYRGKGYGKQLFECALKELEGRCTGLDGVPSEIGTYERYGFKLAHNNIRFEYINRIGSHHDPFAVDAFEVATSALEEYDLKHFQYPRKAFLRKWLDMPKGESKVYLSSGRIKGYGTIRKCSRGYKIGPLFADDALVADALFQSLCSTADLRSEIYLDVPEVNPQAVKFATKYGMQKVFGTARMYLGSPKELPLGDIFGITSFELG